MHKKIFSAILCSTLCALLFALGAIIFFAYSYIANDEQKRAEETCLVLLNAYNLNGRPFLEILKSPQISRYRITLISPEGSVTFDTAEEDIHENHSDRAEVKQAMAKGFGDSNRYSDTLNERTYYKAVRADDGMILRLAVTSHTILSYVKSIALTTLIVFAVTALICLFASLRLTQAIIRPLYDIDFNRPLDDGGAYPEILPFLHEIDKRQQAVDEKAAMLHRKNEEFLTITKSMSEGLVLLNAQGIILTINKTAKKIFNITDEAIGQSFLTIDRSERARAFFFPDIAKEDKSPGRKAGACENKASKAKDKRKDGTGCGKDSDDTGTLSSLNFTLIEGEEGKKSCEIVKDGRDYQLRFNKIMTDGKPAGFALLVIDITDRKRLEEQRQEFTANVSHELKTPLQSIMGAAELMQNGLVAASDIPSFAGKIRRQSSRLITLIEDIIFLSKLDDANADLLKETFSLQAVIEDVFEILKDKAGQKQVQLEFKGSDVLFCGVSRYIYELIYNLTDNAIGYSDKIPGKVLVTLKEKGSNVILTVEDNGRGIAKEHQSRIFERFYRVDKSHSRQSGGTGLGLSIVKRVVLCHQGKIKLRSTPGAGSAFKVILPKMAPQNAVLPKSTRDQTI